MKRTLSLLALVLFAALPAAARAQSNLRPGLDLGIILLDSGIDVVVQGRDGDYPTGRNGLGMSVTHCNLGTMDIPWQGAMDEDHPFTAYMIVREDADRLVQISEYGFAKHEYFALSSTQCGNCTAISDGSFLAPGCSHTSGHGASGDRFVLGPQEEIDPWLGTWTAQSSFFDCPDGQLVCDGERSYFGAEPSPVNHRVTVLDEDLLDAGSTYYYAAHDVARGEAENLRHNNLMSREFRPNWTGSTWQLVTEGYPNPNSTGPVIERWTGAFVNSGTNGADDGRVYVASKVTPSGADFHYEYALYNRDNSGSIQAFSVPITPGAQVTNFGFHDPDANADNDWTISISAGILTVAHPSNPLRWNSIYNFWFDCDVAPVNSMALLTQDLVMGAAQPSFQVMTEGPGGAPAESFCFGDGGASPGCNPCPCGNDAPPGSLGGCRNSSSRSAVLIKSGTGSVAAGDLVMRVQEANGETFSLLTSGSVRLPNVLGICPAGTGVHSPDILDGLRCVGGTLRRHGIRALLPDGSSATDWGAPGSPTGSIAAQGGFTPGQTRHFQVVYREIRTSVCETGRNTSNAISVTFGP